MGYEQEKKKRIQIFEDTLDRCRESSLAEAIEFSRSHTILYCNPVDELQDLMCNRFVEKAPITVTRQRTFEAAEELCTQYPDKKIGVLNFASATNPGGGVVNGSGAQEECLCRCSTLYPCLRTSALADNFYNYHRMRHNTYYTDRCIYIPDIIVLKTDTLFPEALPEKDRYKVDVVTCPAPNLRRNKYADKSGMTKELSQEELSRLIMNRIDGIMRVFVKQEVDIPVLGAFGCGAFCNDPVMIAECFKEWLEVHEDAFYKVVFAVFCPPKDDSNYRIFRKIIMET